MASPAINSPISSYSIMSQEDYLNQSYSTECDENVCSIDKYQDAIQCYEQLLVISQSSYQLATPATAQLIDACVEKVEAILQLERSVTYLDELHTQIINALFISLHELYDMKELKQCPVRNDETTAFRRRQGAEDKMKQEIENTQITPSASGFADVAGMEHVKQILTTVMLLPLRQPQLFDCHKLCNSVLLFGPPGTGKTRIAHAVAAEMSVKFFSITSSHILSKYVGETERMIRTLFETIREPSTKPRLLFMDEIDALCQKRRENESDYSRRLKTQIMCELSNIEDSSDIYLICATNCPWDIDSAFLRRFQRRIYVPLPDRSDRYELLKLLTKDVHLQVPFESWTQILNLTEGFSGSDISDLVRNAFNIRLGELYDTTVWEKLENNKYKPSNGFVTYNVIRSKLSELPENSIEVRNVTIGDLCEATMIVGKTITESDIKKYQTFIEMSK